MKKLLSILLLLVLSLSLVACGNKINSNNSTIEASKLENESFSSFGSTNNSSSSVVTSQQTSSISTVNSLTSQTSFSTSNSSSQPEKTDNYSQAPASIKGVLDNAVGSIVLYENNLVNRDVIVLPRVSLREIVYIEWYSADENIIDVLGNVYQKDFVQTVVLTASFSYQGYTKNVNYSLTVAKKAVESIKVTPMDSRIKSTVNVTSTSELKNAVKNVSAGQAIVMKKGVYENVDIQLTANGTEASPIFLIGESSDGVILSGATKLELKGNYAIVANLNFKNGYPLEDKGAIIVRGNNCRITNNNYYKFEKEGEDFKWLSLSGKYAEVDHNVFDGKTVGGALLTVWREDTSAQYHHIHNNVFKNYQKGKEANGYETIRVGDSTQSQSDAFCLIENNLFENINGEVEIVSVKSGRNVIRNNVFKISAGLLTFRHGKNNLAESNVFLCGNTKDSGGVRAYDGGHIIRNNYVENVNTSSDSRGGIVIHSGVNEIGDIPELNAQWTAYNVLVESNTVYNSDNSLYFCDKYSVAPKKIEVKNNLIVTSESALFMFDDKITASFSNNKAYCKNLFDENSKIFNFKVDEFYYSSVISQKPVGSDLYLESGIGAKNLLANQCGNAGNFD